MAIDPNSGGVRVLVGGREYANSPFNRAVLAWAAGGLVRRLPLRLDQRAVDEVQPLVADLAAALGAFDGDAKPGEEGNLSGYILMRRIFPPANRTLALRRGETSEMETLSELGVYVGYLRVGEEVVMNECGGHLLRTKAATSDEGGVAAGFAVLDSPLLVDE